MHMNSVELGVEKGEVILQFCKGAKKRKKEFSRNSGCANLDPWSLGRR